MVSDTHHSVRPIVEKKYGQRQLVRLFHGKICCQIINSMLTKLSTFVFLLFLFCCTNTVGKSFCLANVQSRKKRNWVLSITYSSDLDLDFLLIVNLWFMFQSNPYGLKDTAAGTDMGAWTSAGLQPTTGYYSYDPMSAYGYVNLYTIYSCSVSFRSKLRGRYHFATFLLS